MPDDELTIQRNKRLLEEIRLEREKQDGDSEDLGSRGHSADREEGSGRDTAGVAQRPLRTGRRTQGAGETYTTPQRDDTRVRPTNGASIGPDKGSDTAERKSEQPVTPVFQWRNPFPKVTKDSVPVKLFTKQEAEDEFERMYEIYFRGSGLLDDVLEIIVKDHEPVKIWQLDEGEAKMLTEMHLSRAQKDVASARSARKMLEIYDRLYMYILLGPRVKATADFVKAHHGLGFK